MMALTGFLPDGVPTPTRTAINSLGNYCSILLSYGDTEPMSIMRKKGLPLPDSQEGQIYE